jgi:hypothetical protein
MGIRSFPGRTIDVTTATGTGNIAVSTSLNKAFRLVAITIHFSTGTNNSITITLNANAGADYDTVLRTITTSGTTDVFWMPDHELLCKKGDEIDVAWTNDATYTYGLRIVTEEV